MELSLVPVEKPEGTNIILGQSHFIKTVEDLYETLMNGVPGIEFGIAFCEASQKRLVRVDGNHEQLIECASSNALNIGAGHVFIVVIREAFPINVLNDIKDVPEVCTVFCATANEVKVVVTESGDGRGIVGVIDGQSPVGVEGDEDVQERKKLLRDIGYKR